MIYWGLPIGGNICFALASKACNSRVELCSTYLNIWSKERISSKVGRDLSRNFNAPLYQAQ